MGDYGDEVTLPYVDIYGLDGRLHPAFLSEKNANEYLELVNKYGFYGLTKIELRG